jgi:hypothetical protein
VRRAVGDLLAHAERLLCDDIAGEPMADCFEKALLAEVTVVKFAGVLTVTLAETPVTLGGITTKYALISFCLGVQSRVLADTEFVSRQDVEQVRDRVNQVFAVVEEAAADAMDSTTFQSLVRLHAAVIAHLTETARPLPRILQFRFAQPLPTLVIAYKLYADASRCDELRTENKVVHPAFMLPSGIALSA